MSADQNDARTHPLGDQSRQDQRSNTDQHLRPRLGRHIFPQPDHQPFPLHRHNQAPLYGLRELSNKSRRRPHPAGAPTPGSIIRPIMAKTPSSDQNQFANKAPAWSARFTEPVSELVKRYTA